ncbi:hypothetical protein [Deefgea piscis]|uniref:hypothetical protein n=1 Tax=Deefgea piscis TaxID=2739061 RepID=UPI001C820CFD|nr:hypothetical protein [Deefgea piscis]QZA81483.1 hypothetical protein K4H25_02110 [Deefgea piscis]
MLVLFSLQQGVDGLSVGGYSSASLLLTQQTKQAVFQLVSVSKPLIFNKIQPMSVSAWFASQTSAYTQDIKEILVSNQVFL